MSDHWIHFTDEKGRHSFSLSRKTLEEFIHKPSHLPHEGRKEIYSILATKYSAIQLWEGLKIDRDGRNKILRGSNFYDILSALAGILLPYNRARKVQELAEKRPGKLFQNKRDYLISLFDEKNNTQSEPTITQPVTKQPPSALRRINARLLWQFINYPSRLNQHERKEIFDLLKQAYSEEEITREFHIGPHGSEKILRRQNFHDILYAFADMYLDAPVAKQVKESDDFQKKRLSVKHKLELVKMFDTSNVEYSKDLLEKSRRRVTAPATVRIFPKNTELTDKEYEQDVLAFLVQTLRDVDHRLHEDEKFSTNTDDESEDQLSCIIFCKDTGSVDRWEELLKKKHADIHTDFHFEIRHIGDAESGLQTNLTKKTIEFQQEPPKGEQPRFPAVIFLCDTLNQLFAKSCAGFFRSFALGLRHFAQLFFVAKPPHCDIPPLWLQMLKADSNLQEIPLKHIEQKVEAPPPPHTVTSLAETNQRPSGKNGAEQNTFSRSAPTPHESFPEPYSMDSASQHSHLLENWRTYRLFSSDRKLTSLMVHKVESANGEPLPLVIFTDCDMESTPTGDPLSVRNVTSELSVQFSDLTVSECFPTFAQTMELLLPPSALEPWMRIGSIHSGVSIPYLIVPFSWATKSVPVSVLSSPPYRETNQQSLEQGDIVNITLDIPSHDVYQIISKTNTSSLKELQQATENRNNLHLSTYTEDLCTIYECKCISPWKSGPPPTISDQMNTLMRYYKIQQEVKDLMSYLLQLLTIHTYKKHSSVPYYWTHMPRQREVQFEQLNPSGAEYQHIRGSCLELFSQKQIEKIERIQNRRFWDKFHNQVEDLKRAPNRRHYYIRKAFFSTPHCPPSQISSRIESFQTIFKYRLGTGTEGLYASVDPLYYDQQCFEVPTQPEWKQFLILKIIFFPDDKQGKVRNEFGEFYFSKEESHVYPEYIVTYQDKED